MADEAVPPDGAGIATSAPVRGSTTAVRLRQAAHDAFADLGWQATRVEDIVQRAGVSHGTFYTHYTNKAAVLEEMVRISQADLAALAARPWEADDVRSALERIIGGLVELYERDAAVLRAWLEAARHEPQFSELYVELRALYVDRVAENLESVAAMSQRRDRAPVRTLASALVAMVEHTCYSWLALGERHEHADVMESMVLIWGSTLNALAGFELVEL